MGRGSQCMGPQEPTVRVNKRGYPVFAYQSPTAYSHDAGNAG